MILFIDDEKRKIKNYVEELKLLDFEVELIPDVDSAIKFIENNSKDIKLLVLDIMMPAGETFKNIDTENGLRTGRRLYEKVRNNLPNLPIIIFTNVSDSSIAAMIQQEERIVVLSKTEFLPHELSKEVKKILES